MTEYLYKSARTDGPYRYRLTRRWSRNLAPDKVLFVMLNPSTADGEQDDPTIRKCVGFAKRWGFGALEVVNLFAHRVTDPRDLLKAARAGVDVVGPKNQEAVYQASWGAEAIVAAWGRHGSLLDQCSRVIDWLPKRFLIRPLVVDCLGLTANGQPRHPLMVPYETRLQTFYSAD